MISEASSITYPTSEKGSIFSLTTHHLPNCSWMFSLGGFTTFSESSFSMHGL